MNNKVANLQNSNAFVDARHLAYSGFIIFWNVCDAFDSPALSCRQLVVMMWRWWPRGVRRRRRVAITWPPSSRHVATRRTLSEATVART
ncbi:hypothetical protein RR48_14076 [Papilio machaon]|uniref:Uncharacterized protein n=1 Tax=Papilio machaon TaxID=76193 RepID=A0A194QLC5_PAPMA|nr:hypothetical protein RR48_14076 [Papilio machaon]